MFGFGFRFDDMDDIGNVFDRIFGVGRQFRQRIYHDYVQGDNKVFLIYDLPSPEASLNFKIDVNTLFLNIETEKGVIRDTIVFEDTIDEKNVSYTVKNGVMEVVVNDAKIYNSVD